ncbi:inositol monophosphatase family protein [Duganella callida]|uniref:Inositol monophosphatase n=1 Tax=Duganella callida TaxID=2561932 RepID=A0A4Y9SXL1_9BURK|nr:inositol monophosphatase [Duganella callida]TFW30277.1 inositol monophosphatase [Duganella callida]
MTYQLDLDRCARLLQQVTDAIAADAPHHARNATVPELIDQVHAVNAIAEPRLRAELQALYPAIGWRDEDSAAFDDAAPHWVYDPIDGAYHYLQGLPLWSASLALVADGRAVAAIVYDPALGEMFMAQAGEGARSATAPLRVSPKTELAAAVAGTAVPPRLQAGVQAQQEALCLLTAVAPKVFVLRPMAATSLQLAYVAAGRLDVYWETGNDAADWLAGALLVREAGGLATALDGGGLGPDSRGIVAGNGELVRQLRAATGIPSRVSLA